jgi:hypothetical protein
LKKGKIAQKGIDLSWPDITLPEKKENKIILAIKKETNIADITLPENTETKITLALKKER